jgi:hypothetical protein
MQQLTCQVCQTANDTYAMTCTSCGGFLQDKVPNLDLFHTIWRVIESPKEAFKIITLATHKNYSIFLFSLFGIALTFCGFWYFKAGDKFENIIPLIIFGIGIGLLIGAFLAPIFTFLHWILSLFFSRKGSFKISLGITSYSIVPLILAFVFILPIELMTFGMYMFTFNPHPMTIKPLEYITFSGLYIILFIWSSGLLFLGTSVGCQLSWWKAGAITILFIALASQVIVLLGEWAFRFI